MYEWFCILLVLSAFAVLLLGFPVAFSLGGTALIFAGIGYTMDYFDNTALINAGSRIFGNIMIKETLVAVPLFVFMGVMLERSKIAEQLLDTMSAVFMGLRGGLAISVVIVGLLLGASTGIVGATVVTMGLISLPTMMRHQYAHTMATGTIAASGTLGQIIPPSIVLVLLGSVISNEYANAQTLMGIFSPDSVSIGDLFVGAVIPGLLLVGLYCVYIVLVAIFKPQAMPPTPRTQKVTLMEIVTVLIPPLVLIVVVLGSIMFGVATPTESAAVGAVGALLLSEIYQGKEETLGLKRMVAFVFLGLIALFGLSRLLQYAFAEGQLPAWYAAWLQWLSPLTGGLLLALVVFFLLYKPQWSRIREVTRTTTQISAMVFLILIGATLFSAVFRGFQGDEIVQNLLSDLPGGALGAMLVVMLVMFVLGFFLDFFEITFVVIPIVATPLLMMGLDPVWLGIMFAMNLQTSFLTPPFGFSLFYLRGVAPSSIKTEHIYRGIIPFVIIQLLAIGALALWPELATWLPGVMLPD